VKEDDIETFLTDASVSVFATMLSFNVTVSKTEEDFFNGESHIAGAVGFTGAYNGVIYFYSSATFARRLTCGLLGMSDHEIEGDEMVNDAVGELTNMIAGQVKSKLDSRGDHCTMTVPSVVRGADFRIEPVTGVERRSLFFQCDGGRVLVEALIKSAEAEQK
jgi:chemotaxis protein CheX